MAKTKGTKEDKKDKVGKVAEKREETQSLDGYVPRLKDRYLKTVLPGLMKQFSYRNVLQAPRLEKVVVNVGLGEAIQNAKLLDSAVKELAIITGQQPVATKAKKSIANFKIRAGMSIGCSVTIRGNRMYEFLDRLLNVALPRIRDFRGLSEKSFDGRGNYSFGIKEQLIFPEIHYDEVVMSHGMDVTIVTTARNNNEGKALLESMGVPFRKS
jgi:large subunit ribosomal protein L5